MFAVAADKCLVTEYNTSVQPHKEYYCREKFAGLVIDRQNICAVTFDECEFTSCSFTGSIIERGRFLDCKFNDCNLSSCVHLDSVLIRPQFRGCKIIGVDWTLAQKLEQPGFYECRLNYSNFKFLQLSGAAITRSEVKEAYFVETNLTGCDCTYSDFEKSLFFKVDLTGADFRNARNYSIDVMNNIVRKTRFSLPEAVSLLRSLDIILE